MSKNSKNAKRHIAARQMSEQRKKGNKGPASTTPKHGKKKAWWQLYNSYGEWVRSAKRKGND